MGGDNAAPQVPPSAAADAEDAQSSAQGSKGSKLKGMFARLFANKKKEGLAQEDANPAPGADEGPEAEEEEDIAETARESFPTLLRALRGRDHLVKILVLSPGDADAGVVSEDGSMVQGSGREFVEHLAQTFAPIPEAMLLTGTHFASAPQYICVAGRAGGERRVVGWLGCLPQLCSDSAPKTQGVVFLLRRGGCVAMHGMGSVLLSAGHPAHAHGRGSARLLLHASCTRLLYTPPLHASFIRLAESQYRVE